MRRREQVLEQTSIGFPDALLSGIAAARRLRNDECSGVGSLLAGAVVAGMTTIPNERFATTGEEDTHRTATELIQWVTGHYKRQGWIRP